MEKVDILIPPTFEKSGIIKTRDQAVLDRDWVWTFNLWIVQKDPVPSIVYQVRSPNKSRAPGKLDVSAGGFYLAWEELKDGLREVQEELWKEYQFQDIHYLWRRAYVWNQVDWGRRNNIVDLGIIIDNKDLNIYTLEPREIYAIASVPIDELIKIHTVSEYIYEIEILTATWQLKKKVISKDDFPYNRDNYHFKMALVAKKFIEWEENILY